LESALDAEQVLALYDWGRKEVRLFSTEEADLIAKGAKR
jgi:hypothetical protein